jgi:hypothetical protein
MDQNESVLNSNIINDLINSPRIIIIIRINYEFNYIGLININNYYNGPYFLHDKIINLEKNNNEQMIIGMVTVKICKTNKYYYKLTLDIIGAKDLKILQDNKFIILSYNNKNIYEIVSEEPLSFSSRIVNTDEHYSFIKGINIINIISKHYNYFTLSPISLYKYYSLDNKIFYEKENNNYFYLDLNTNENLICVANFCNNEKNKYYVNDNNIIYSSINDTSINPQEVYLINKTEIIVYNKNSFYYHYPNKDPEIYDTLQEYNNTILDFKEYNYKSNIKFSNYNYYTSDNQIYYAISDTFFCTNLIIDSSEPYIKITLCKFDFIIINIK